MLIGGMVLILLVVISFLIVISYYNHYDVWLKLPKHETFEDIYPDLVSGIIDQADQNKCWGYIRSLEANNIKGPDDSLDNILVIRVSDALTGYNKWKVLIDSEQKKINKKIRGQYLKNYGELDDNNELENMILSEKKREENIRYRPVIKWWYTTKEKREGYVFINLQILQEKTDKIVFSLEDEFAHPASIEKWRRNLGRAKFFWIIFLSSSTLLLLVILNRFFLFIWLEWRNKKRKEGLLHRVQMRDILFEQGHYITLIELLEEYLIYFPEDTEQRAFYYRVLDFTGNDPKTAQTAYVETKKLQSRLQQYLDHPQSTILTEEEKEKLKPLMAHHPELKATVTQLTALESSAQKQEEAEKASEHIIQAIRLGDLEEAQHDVTILESHGYDPLQLGQWKEDIEAKRTEAQNLFSEAKGMFSKGKIEEGEKKLAETLIINREHKEALSIKEMLTRAESCSQKKYHLTSQNRDIYIIFKESLLLGRGDEGIAPDILFEDRRVSRKHATLTYEKGKWMINDLESTGGTYVNGSAVHSSPLNDGDTLTLAKVHEFLIHAVIPDKGSPGLVLEGRHSTYLIFPTEGSFAKASFMKTDKEHTLFLSKEKTRLLLSWEEGFHFIIPGDSIETPHADFRILEN